MRAGKLTRRDMLKLAGLGGAATVVAACQPQVVEKTVVVKEAVQVEKEVTRVVKEVVQPKAAERKPITLVMMYGAQEFPENERKLFEEKYAPYKLQFINNDMTKLMAMLAAGQQLDVYRTWGITAPYDVFRRLPLDLTDYFAVSEVFKADDILPVNDYYIVHGRRYGFVKDWSPDYSAWIRKDFFTDSGIEPPTPDKPVPLKTWREWSKPLKRVEGDRILRWGTGWTPLKNPIFYQPTTLARPRSLFSEDFTKLRILEDPEILEIAKFMFDWKQEGGIPSVINPTIGGWTGPDFRDGVSASAMYGYWYSGFLMDAKWDLNKNAVMLPAPSWGPTYSNPCAAGTGGAVSSQTRYSDAAWALFQYFFGEEPAENRAKIGWGVPGLKHLLDLMPKDQPWRAQVLAMVRWEMDNSTVFKIDASPYIDPNLVGTVWNKYEEPALKGEMAFEEFLKNVETDLNEAIKEGMDRAGL